jgi:cell division protein FtsW (lipid II flippase)
VAGELSAQAALGLLETAVYEEDERASRPYSTGSLADTVSTHSKEEHMLWYILFVVLWIAIAFWPARVAARKGHSFFLYFLFSLVFFPLALLVAYMVDDRTRAPATS